MPRPPLSIVELLARVGAENIQVQNVEESLVSANVVGDKGRIAFATDPGIVQDIALGRPGRKVGLIVWIPRDKLPSSGDAESSIASA